MRNLNVKMTFESAMKQGKPVLNVNMYMLTIFQVNNIDLVGNTRSYRRALRILKLAV